MRCQQQPQQAYYLWTAIIVSLVMCYGGSAKKDCGEHCYKTSHRLTDPATEEWATTQSRCLAVCVDKLTSYCPSCRLEPSLQGQWNSVDYNAIKNNCTVYRMLLDCQRGCAIRFNDSTTNRCSNQCMLQCPNAIKNPRISCNVSCMPIACEFGCTGNETDLEFNDSFTDYLLSAPIRQPKLTSLKDYSDYSEGGQYLYQFTVPEETNVTSYGAVMTTFVFKITTKDNNNSFYISEVTSWGVLNLGFLTCTEVNVSYRAITSNSSSAYSDEYAMTVDGSVSAVNFPSQVNFRKINVSFTEDFRDDYIGHAHVLFTWPEPANAHYLTHYRLTILSQTNNCGGKFEQYEYCIDKDSTNVTISANTPEEPMFFRCKYLVRLISEPIQQTDSDLPGFEIDIELSTPKPSVTIRCQRYFQSNGKLTAYAVWSVPYVQGLIEAIDVYEVTVQLYDTVSHTKSLISAYENIAVEPDVNRTLNVFVANDLDVISSNDRKYYIRVYTRSNHLFPWRHMPDYASCYIDPQPDPPFPLDVNQIDVLSLQITETRLFLNVSWAPPLDANGRLTRYELRIARQPFSEASDPTDYSFTRTVNGTLTNATIDTEAIYQIDKIVCLYLQIRSMNDYLWSNWSSHVTLSKYPNNPSCQSVAISPVATVTSSEPTTQRTVVLTVAGSVVGGIAGLILLSVLLVAVTVYCRRYQRRNRYLEAFKESNTDPLYTTGPMSPGVFSTKSLESPKLDEWEIPANMVVIENRLGEGCFGEVYQGVVKGPISNHKVQASFKNAICPVVAIKLLKATATGSEKMDFLQEIDTMKRVSKGNNPHVVNMIGCVTIQEPLCLITEFVKHGDLHSYLQSIRKMVTQSQSLKAASVNSQSLPYTIPSLDIASPSKRASIAVVPNPGSPYADLGEIESVNLLSFAYQIASGMEFLASLGIVHRDLASRNILVDDGKSLKISDFGMSRTVAANDVYVKNTRGRLPWKWMAIESIVNREFTSASDVWSYGVTLWEIATLGGFPYPTITNTELLEHLQKGMRLEKPDNCSQDVYEIMLECWLVDPHNRPTFTALRAKFDSLISAQQDHVPYIDLDIDYGKPYYASVDSSGDEDKHGSSDASEISTDSSSDVNPIGFDVIRPMFENTADKLPRPVANPYVDTPTKLNTHELTFEVLTDSSLPEVLQSPLKKGARLMEAA